MNIVASVSNSYLVYVCADDYNGCMKYNELAILFFNAKSDGEFSHENNRIERGFFRGWSFKHFSRSSTCSQPPKSTPTYIIILTNTEHIK